MKKSILQVMVVFALFICSCAVRTHYIQDGAEAYEPTSPEDVKVYSGDIFDYKYIVIGSVAVDKPGDGDAALEILKEEAASIGADAVINVRLSKISSTVTRTGLSGTAVRIVE